VTDNQNTYRLVRGVGIAWFNLLNLLSQDISSEEFIKQLNFIKNFNFDHLNTPSDNDLVAFANLEQRLQTSEPNELPSFELLKQLSDFRNRLKQFKFEWPGQESLLNLALRLFEMEILCYLSSLYGGKEIREIRFPSEIRDQNAFQHGMNILHNSSGTQRELIDKCEQFWMELIDLWLKLDLSQQMRDEVEAFRKIVKPSA
jgi:superfamily I DNA and/or RNA helicase